MRLLFKAIFAALTLLPAQIHAQSTADIHARAIKEFLAQDNLEKAKPPRLPRGTPSLAPSLMREEIRFGFQKRMALAGHGILYDLEGNKVELSAREMRGLQKEILEAARADADRFRMKNDKPLEELSGIVAEMEEFALSKDQSQDEAFLTANLLIRSIAYQMRPAIRDTYLWRAEYLSHRWRLVRDLKVLELRPVDRRLRGWFINWRDILRDPDNGGNQGSSYVQSCRDAGVPVPPDFQTTGTAWRQQGSLTINMLDPGDTADVFTWSDPHKRGACVALPRYDDDGNAGLNGIICQGAETGNACIWDNLWAGTNTRVDWTVEPMVIDQLEDGTGLWGCNSCHQGNNAFLMAPDDPTWCRLMRGDASTPNCLPIVGAHSNNFTTEVEGNVRPITAGGTTHSRFVFLTGSPPRMGWENNAGAGCGAACHLVGDLGLVNNNTPPATQLMPPNCGASCN